MSNPERDLLSLERSTRERLREAFARYHARYGRRYEPVITQTYRGPKGQAKALAAGASKKAFGASYHNFVPAFAVDFLLQDTISGRLLDGKSRADELVYMQLGEVLEEVGFTWGGRWKDPVDMGHAQAPISLEDIRAGRDPAWLPLAEETP
jgi:hypothetical protein